MKNILTAVVLFVLFGMFASANAQQMVQSGKFMANGDTPGYTLDKNSGDRSVSLDVTFLTPFETKPDIVLSLVAIDADKAENLRYSIETKSVSRDGFTVKINTWGASKLYAITGNWLAHTK
ncbi:MAG: H-type lectin domain-containing protein [Ignavibacteriaceae bacterium]|nr:H-type lectin domain-containing protein [Ignavibacteriaceae bacterium]